MRLLLSATLLLTVLGLHGCGPRESPGQVRDPDPAEAPDRDPARAAAKKTAEPKDVPSSDWSQRPVDARTAAMVQAHIDGLMSKYYTLAREIDTVRSRLEQFTHSGRTWSPGVDPSRPWDQLIRRRFMRAEPVNPFSPSDVATAVHVTAVPGATGETVSPKTAGWVWNSTDRVLDAARDSAAIRACGMEHQRRQVHQTAAPYLDPILESVRGQIALYQLYEDSLWPDGSVAEQQWAPLINAGYLGDTPVNPLSPRDARTRIIEIRTPGARGSAIDAKRAGWVWNSADQELYAAGYDG